MEGDGSAKKKKNCKFFKVAKKNSTTLKKKHIIMLLIDLFSYSSNLSFFKFRYAIANLLKQQVFVKSLQ